MAVRMVYPKRSAFPKTGASGICYVANDTQRRYWWRDNTYKEGLFFRINGEDIAPLIKANGIKWTRNDIDSAKAGRTLSGYMNRGRVVTKVKLEITSTPMNQEQVQHILRLIQPEYVTVEYVDPLYGVRMAEFYSNNVPATTCVETSSGEIVWDEISFPLVER